MRFTVLTPTYNRAHTLNGVYQSLCQQTFRDFEWVIIDDGSTDGTKEMVASWQSFFPIRYTWKPNGGKHTAVNLGVQQAAGELLLIVDSDDRCLPQTLERFDSQWKLISTPERFAALGALCLREDAKTILGDEFSKQCTDCFSLKDCLALAKFDRCGIIRTDILRKFPYPEFKQERFILEGLVWNRIFRKYGVRYINEPLIVHVYAPGGLTSQGDLRYSSPKGAVVYHTELAFSKVPAGVRLKSVVNAMRFSLVAAIREVRMLTSR